MIAQDLRASPLRPTLQERHEAREFVVLDDPGRLQDERLERLDDPRAEFVQRITEDEVAIGLRDDLEPRETERVSQRVQRARGQPPLPFAGGADERHVHLIEGANLGKTSFLAGCEAHGPRRVTQAGRPVVIDTLCALW